MSEYTEGQTATNKQTGEKVVFRDGGWQPLGEGEDPIQRVERDRFSVAKSLFTPSLNPYTIGKELLPEGSVDTAIALGTGSAALTGIKAGKQAIDAANVMKALRGTAATTLKQKLTAMASSPAGITAGLGTAGGLGVSAADAIASTISDIFSSD